MKSNVDKAFYGVASRISKYDARNHSI